MISHTRATESTIKPIKINFILLSQKFFPKEKINRDILSRKENQLLWTFRNYELFVLKFANNEIPFIYKSKANGQMKVNKNTKQNQQKHLLRLRKSVCDINNGIDWHVNLIICTRARVLVKIRRSETIIIEWSKVQCSQIAKGDVNRQVKIILTFHLWAFHIISCSFWAFQIT